MREAPARAALQSVGDHGDPWNMIGDLGDHARPVIVEDSGYYPSYGSDLLLGFPRWPSQIAAPPPNPPYAMRKLPKQRRASTTVDAILEAAARILVETGYATVSTNRIAERAGVGIGSLYEYFPGKEAIFAELRRREMAKWYARLLAGPGSGKPEEVIRHIVAAQVRYAVENPPFYAALEFEVPVSTVAELQNAIQGHFLALSTAYLEDHRERHLPQGADRACRGVPVPLGQFHRARFRDALATGTERRSPRQRTRGRGC